MSPRRRPEAEPGEAAPTMIIPRGAQIEVDSQGQLSVQAPGNLVIQNSGRYGTLESIAGSIRIDRAVEVEAVTVRCADTCYVQGSLTAWRVVARCLHLEDTARAHVVLQETARLEVGRDARMVGNFASENELLGLFARFAHQVRSLPFALERGQPAALAAAEETPTAAEPSTSLAELPEPLLFALVLLEREAEMKIHGPISQRAIRELLKLLEEQDLETLRATYRTLFGRVVEPREDVRRARELVGGYYDGGG
ncbi:MAG TPA: hypothetical protein VOA87_03190 [Thermoanaerobaculia bacterium]|nr:hypothetical protein [Thermoanaerobaculia bacterium]